MKFAYFSLSWSCLAVDTFSLLSYALKILRFLSRLFVLLILVVFVLKICSFDFIFVSKLLQIIDPNSNNKKYFFFSKIKIRIFINI